MQIAYAAGDDVLVTGGYDQAIRLWDCRSRSFDPIQTMKSFGDSVTSVAIADRHVTAACSACASLLMRHTCWPSGCQTATPQVVSSLGAALHQ